MKERRFDVFGAVQLVSVLIFVWFLATWTSPWSVQRYVGTVLAVLGLSFIGLARYQLGRSFSVRPEAIELVTHGLYSKIRNPIYVSSTLVFAGLILVIQRPRYWIVVVIVVVIQIIRARREAHVLEAAFGDAYREYRKKTWF
jgi:protein-S-isoprenylcysteine O-methyltransferase Ste14